MSQGDDDGAEIRQLVGQRADALAVLVRNDREKAELVDDLDVSRSTVDRMVRRLESAELVRRNGSHIEATLAGRLAYDTYRDHCDRTADIARFDDLLRELPPTADLGHDLLDGATAYRSEPPATGRPVNEFKSLLGEATRIRGCASVINDEAAVAELHEMVVDRGGRAMVVYAEELAAHIREEYFEGHHVMAATGRYRAYEVDGVPYELFLLDSDAGTTVVVAIYDSTGKLKGTIVNDTDPAVAWGEATFERYRQAATEFTDDFRVGRDEDRDD
jgi:predicted transcriptional regulator